MGQKATILAQGDVLRLLQYCAKETVAATDIDFSRVGKIAELAKESGWGV